MGRKEGPPRSNLALLPLRKARREELSMARAMWVTRQEEVLPAPRRPCTQYHLGPGKAIGNITLTLTFACM